MSQLPTAAQQQGRDQPCGRKSWGEGQGERHPLIKRPTQAKKNGPKARFSKYREDYFLAALNFSQSAFSLASILDASALQASSIFFLSASLMAPPCEPAIAAEANIIDATITEKTLVMIYSYLSNLSLIRPPYYA